MTRCFLFILTAISSFIMTNIYADAVTAAVSPSIVKPQYSPLKATLNLRQEGQRLYAYVFLEQPQTDSGKVRIDWTPPLHSSCDKSTYILSYQGKKFHTRAYRTLGYSLINGKSINCTGTWKADVRNEQGTPLATAIMTIRAVNVDAYAHASVNAKMQSLAAIA